MQIEFEFNWINIRKDATKLSRKNFYAFLFLYDKFRRLCSNLVKIRQIWMLLDLYSRIKQLCSNLVKIRRIWTLLDLLSTHLFDSLVVVYFLLFVELKRRLFFFSLSRVRVTYYFDSFQFLYIWCFRKNISSLSLLYLVNSFLLTIDALFIRYYR